MAEQIDFEEAMLEGLEDEGIERDLEDSSEETFVASDSVMFGTDWTLETLYQQVIKGNIDLNPSFQRRDAWDVTKKSKLVEALVVGMPVPPIVLAEKNGQKGKYIVIDGKQRLLSICQFFSSENETSPFSKLVLKNLSLKKEMNGKTYSELDAEQQASFENQTLRTQIIKNWRSERFLYTIFLNLNTGSQKLYPQELRQALHAGPFLDFLESATGESEQFGKILKNGSPDSRMRDVELALRSFALKFRFEEYGGNLKTFLDTTCQELNQNWCQRQEEFKSFFSNIEAAIEHVYIIFGKKAFSKPTGRVVFNRALFEMFVYYLSDSLLREHLSEESALKRVEESFKNLYLQDKRFQETISLHFDKQENVEYRFKKIQEILQDASGQQLPSVNLTNGIFAIG